MPTAEEKAQKEIQRLVSDAKKMIEEACAIADKHKLSFGWNLAYGMGGYYEGNPDERGEYNEDGWISSSSGC